MSNHVCHSDLYETNCSPISLFHMQCTLRLIKALKQFWNLWCQLPLFLDYVQEHWKEDVFFGYQYLNGINPMLIRRCTALPSNFPVTDDMVFLHGQSRLEEEMKVIALTLMPWPWEIFVSASHFSSSLNIQQKGNIFLADYKILDGVKQNVINRKKQYLMAPLVLLHKTPQDQLMPVAIQVRWRVKYRQ